MDKIYDKRCHIPPPPPISMLLAPKHFSHEDFIGGGGGGKSVHNLLYKVDICACDDNKITKYVLFCGRTANLLKFVNEEVECDHKGVKLAFKLI